MSKSPSTGPQQPSQFVPPQPPKAGDPAPAGWQGAPPGWNPPPPPKKKHTVRNVFLVIIALCILGMGGCTAMVFAGANKVANDIDSHQTAVGGPENPLTIHEGKKFSVRKFDYAAGWSLSTDALGDLEVKGLKVTNHRAKRDAALVTIKVLKGSEVVASADCTTDQIQPGQTVTVKCLSTDPKPKDFTSITINDDF